MAEKQYRVKWEIDIWANTPKQAAVKALKIQRDCESIATCFDVGYLKTTAPKTRKIKSQYIHKTIDLHGWE